MAIGTDNKRSVIKALRKKDFILGIYEVGLIVSRFHKYIAVSPDGIALIEVDDCQHVATVEIKSRVKESTREASVSAAMKHGVIVRCDYNDSKFKDCVILSNCQQILHQAATCNVQYSLYVVSGVKDGIGSFIQILIIDCSKDVTQEYYAKVQNFGSKFMGWLYEHTVMKRGYLIDSDFPSWVTYEQRDIVSSRYKMWIGDQN